MTLSILVGNTIKNIALTLLSEIAMKALEQKDYARLIRFTGVSAIAVDVVTYIKGFEKNPPLLWRITKESWQGWKDFLGNFGIFD